MSRIDAWSGSAFPLAAWNDHNQSVDNAIIIADAGSSITIKRGATTLSSQTVRIEWLTGKGQTWTEAGKTYQVDALIIGYYNHDTIANTDIKPGDRFAYAGAMYEVVGLIVGTSTTIQAYARVLA